MMERMIAAVVLSMLALSGSFLVAIIVTILFTRHLEPPETETDGTEA